MRKNDIPTIDLFTAADEDRAVSTLATHEGNGRVAVNSANYLQGLVFTRILHREVPEGSEPVKQGELAERFGKSASTMSKLAQVAGWLCSDEDSEETKNLATYWGFAHPDPLAVSFVQVRTDFAGQDGEARHKALKLILETFGAPSSAYSIGKGTKLHPNDPRAAESSEKAEAVERSDKGADELLADLAALALRCKRAGAEDAAIIDAVTAAITAE